MDPHAENYRTWSGYNYVMNNPVNMIDPDGKDPYYNWWSGQYEDRDKKGDNAVTWQQVQNFYSIGSPQNTVQLSGANEPDHDLDPLYVTATRSPKGVGVSLNNNLNKMLGNFDAVREAKSMFSTFSMVHTLAMENCAPCRFLYDQMPATLSIGFDADASIIAASGVSIDLTFILKGTDAGSLRFVASDRVGLGTPGIDITPHFGKGYLTGSYAFQSNVTAEEMLNTDYPYMPNVNGGFTKTNSGSTVSSISVGFGLGVSLGTSSSNVYSSKARKGGTYNTVSFGTGIVVNPPQTLAIGGMLGTGHSRIIR